MIIEKSEDKNCDFNDFKRVRYFHGMLMGDRDFREEQVYHIEKRKMLNKMLHGWGVVCGLGLSTVDCKSSTISIGKGLALDCNGNEIFVNAPYELDVAEAIKSCSASKKQMTAEETCLQQGQPVAEFDTWYVVIKYREVPVTPVPVYAPGGGCEEKVCENSRIREGFCIELHKKKPEQPQQDIDSLDEMLLECQDNSSTSLKGEKVKYKQGCPEGKLEEFMKAFCDSTPDCPSCCPCEHYMILGTVVVDTVNSTKTYSVYSNEGRQYVMTPNLFKYLFRVIFEGAEDILKGLFPVVCADVPDVNLLHENPIAALCWLGDQLPEIIKKRKQKAEAEKKGVEDALEKKIKEIADQYKDMFEKLKAEMEQLKKELKKKADK